MCVIRSLIGFCSFSVIAVGGDDRGLYIDILLISTLLPQIGWFSYSELSRFTFKGPLTNEFRNIYQPGK